MEEYMVLFARYHNAFVRQELIPEIERNCQQFGVYEQKAYDIFQQNKYAENSLYFHHNYAVADIPIGREYEAIAYSQGGEIQADCIQECPSKILCFFTAFRTQPSLQAMQGHHELSLIQFEKVPLSMIDKLIQVTERKQRYPSEQKYLYLGSKIVLNRLVRKEQASVAVAALLEKFGIMNDEDYNIQNERQSGAIYQAIEKLTVEQYDLEDSDIETILFTGLSRLWRKKNKHLK